jgi:hypothetical protein
MGVSFARFESSTGKNTTHVLQEALLRIPFRIPILETEMNIKTGKSTINRDPNTTFSKRRLSVAKHSAKKKACLFHGL